MAVVKKIGNRSSVPTSGVSFLLKTPEGLSLPEGPTAPSEDYKEFIYLIYGERKIGKTSFASKFDDAMFLMCEPGGKGLAIAQVAVNRWVEFVRYVELLTQDDRYKTVVIDTADNAYNFCMDYVCAKIGIDHPGGQDDYGKSWAAVDNEFKRVINLLLQSGKGCVFISHASTREIKTKSGSKFSKLEPSMAMQARRYLIGIVDVVAYYGYDGKDRILVIDGDEYVESGNRITRHFRDKVTGERINIIPMGKSEEEAFSNFIKAFNNELSLTTAKAKKEKSVE